MRTTSAGEGRVRAVVARTRIPALFLAGLWGAAPVVAGPLDAGLTAAAETYPLVTARLSTLLAHGDLAPASVGSWARPQAGAVAGRRGATQTPESIRAIFQPVEGLNIPATFSVILWVRIEPGRGGQPLFGFGEPGGDYLFAGTDSSGALAVDFLNREKIVQRNRAVTAPVNLADGRLHSVVAVMNMASGLTRLYIDGRPEAAATISLWRPRQFGAAFALYSLQGRTNAAGSDSFGLLMPRVVSRELTEPEIAGLQPRDDDPESVSVSPTLESSLLRETLVEFWPAQFSAALRSRPL